MRDSTIWAAYTASGISPKYQVICRVRFPEDNEEP